MQENSNRRLILNSVYLYVRLAIITVCGLLTTRIALQALGEVDFGLFALLGSLLTIVGVICTVATSTSNRFISVAIGKGDTEGASRQFNVNLVIHVALATATVLFALPLGHWYIAHHLSYAGSVHDAMFVFDCSLVGVMLAFVSVPYQGLLTAQEQFLSYCIIDVLSYLGKMLAAWSILYWFEDKLLVYAVAMAVFTGLPTVLYWGSCRIYCPEIVRLHPVCQWAPYRAVFTYSVWMAYGAMATIVKNQGAALLVNAFFTTVMNAALGVANRVVLMAMLIASNVSRPIEPQIYKSYTQGDMRRCGQLLVMASKLSFFIAFLFCVPFFAKCEYILSLWLGQVPSFAVNITLLLLCDALIETFNSGTSSLFYASGRIRDFQLVINTLRLFAVLAGYLALRSGSSPYSLFCFYIGFSVVSFFARQYLMRRELKFDTAMLWRGAYLPSVAVGLAFLPSLLLAGSEIHSVVVIAICELWAIFCVFVLGFGRGERARLYAAASVWWHKVVDRGMRR